VKISLWVCAGLLVLTGCATPGSKNQTTEAIQREMNQAVQDSAQPGKPDAVSNALLPPLTMGLPRVDSKPLETKFDLTVNNTPVNQVFMAIVSGTRYSMLLHPEVSGNISLNLKDVTVLEALEAIRELYGYDYKMDGSRIYIQPITLQTRIFQVNYLTGQRRGDSSLQVSSGTASATTGTVATAGTTATTGTSVSGSSSSNVSMTFDTDFWTELKASLTAIVGTEKGRSIVISPMSGVIVVRAMSDELRNVAAYLKASQISIERQVIIEAKIVEVRLSDGFQSGVNWAAFKQPVLGNIPNSALSAGQVGAGTILPQTAADVGAAAGTTAALASGMTGSLFGLAFQTNNFAALISFLESQGNVQVLSSPRIAAINNQKAILKVGVDESYFDGVASGGGVTTTTAVGTTTTGSTPNTVKFFSGIVLDVTPRIDENNEIILHVHPSVTDVQTINKTATVGGSVFSVPMASKTVSETDSIIRARDGQIVVIGGLMRQSSSDDRSGLPGMPKVVFGQTKQISQKSELIILLKPTVVDSDKDWSDDITQSRNRFSGLNRQDTRP